MTGKNKRLRKSKKSFFGWQNWKKVVAVLAGVAVFATTYALILPAITLEGDTACGIEEHVHSEEAGCYETVLSCGLEEGDEHTHTDDCYETQLICETEEHTHTDECYVTDDSDDSDESDSQYAYSISGTSEDGLYTVTVSYDDGAEIPEGAGLEISLSDEEYDDETLKEILGIIYADSGTDAEDEEESEDSADNAEDEDDSDDDLTAVSASSEGSDNEDSSDEASEDKDASEETEETSSASLISSVSLDISIVSGDEEIEPASAVEVTITSADTISVDEDEDFSVVSISDEEVTLVEDAALEEDKEAGTSTVTFEAESVSDSEYDLMVTAPSDNGPETDGDGETETPPGGNGGDSDDDGNNNGGGDDAEENTELDITAYYSNGFVYWDMNDSDESTYATETNYISSVTLNSIDVTWAESTNSSVGSSDFSWSTTYSTNYTLNDYFPNTANGTYYDGDDDNTDGGAGSENDAATVGLTITPVAGYYVTSVVIVCSAYAESAYQNPYNCGTYDAGNAWSSSFKLSDTTNGAVTVDVTNLYFAHGGYASNYDNTTDPAPVYFILIKVAPIPSPLYVEYDYGDIINLIDDSTASAIFSDFDGWTTNSSRNSYGTGSVQTIYTQYMYSYTEGSPSESANWMHYANTVTTAAKTAAASAGYYFAGWTVEYYSSCTATDTRSNYGDYTYTFSDELGNYETTAAEGANISLITHCRLTAIWVPITMNVTKIVAGLPEGYSDTLTYTLTVNQLVTTTGEDGTATETSDQYGDSITVSTTTNGTYTNTLTKTTTETNDSGNEASTTSSKAVVPGTYSVTESGAKSSITYDGVTYYLSTTYSDNVTFTTSDIMGTLTASSDGLSASNGYITVTYDSNGIVTSVVLDSALTVTNSYSQAVNIQIKKVDSTNSGTTLSGAVFHLYKLDGNTKYYYSNSSSTNDSGSTTYGTPTWVESMGDATALTSGDNGLATLFANLEPGTYYLVETEAPDGYNLLEGAITVTITSTGVTAQYGTTQLTVTEDSDNSTLYTIIVTNSAGYELPETGGAGTYLFTLSGLLLTAAALTVIARRRARRKEDEI